MKQILTALVALVLSIFVFAGSANAKEGHVTMSNSDVSCEAISLWKEGRYRVSGRCEGLVYPYATQYNYYVLWAKTDSRGEYTRVGEVVKGYFDGGIAESFSNLYITAETNNLPRKPSGKNVVSGSIKAFAFDKSEDTTVAVTPAATETSTGTMTVQDNASTSTATSNTTVGKVVSKILTSLLVIVAVVVALVIVTSLVFRRRGSVSA